MATLLLADGLRGQAQDFEAHGFTNLNLMIPDGSHAGLRDQRTIISPIKRISSARVRLRVAGEFNGDLYSYLRHSSTGFTNLCVLLNRPGRSLSAPFGYDDTGLDVIFDAGAPNGDIHVYRSGASPPAGTPLTGWWQPDGRLVDPDEALDTSPRTAGLDAFSGQDASGEWTLYVADLLSGGTNLLVEWWIELSGAVLPQINWPNPAPITYGTALGSSELGAMAVFNSTNVPGTFVYSPAQGTILDAGLGRMLSTTFTPANTDLFLSTSSSVSLDVTRAELTVTATSTARVYGDGNPIFTGRIAGIQNDDPITASYSCPAAANSAVGTYAITPVLSDPDQRLHNYLVTTNMGTLTVSPAPLSVTADNQSRPFGAPNPTLTGSLAGVRNGDAISASYATAADASSPVGTYPIVPSLDDPDGRLSNYNLTTHQGTLTVFNSAPVLNPIPTQMINEGGDFALTITATDPDVPWQALTFSLVPGAPEGSRIDPNTGVFTWTPPISGRSTTNAVTVQVSDNALPPKGDAAAFNIIVVARPRLVSMEEVNGVVTLVWSVMPGLNYQVQYKDNLPDGSWMNLGDVLTATSPVLSVEDNPGAHVQRFYRLLQITNP